jgi:hydrogenase maturation protease
VEDFFREQEGRPALESLVVSGVELKRGSRVMLWPRAGGDIMDIALAGKAAFIEGIEQDYEDRIYVAVTLEDDPGRDLGDARILGHRFFFSPEEVVPLDVENVRES